MFAIHTAKCDSFLNFTLPRVSWNGQFRFEVTQQQSFLTNFGKQAPLSEYFWMPFDTILADFLKIK